MGTADTDVRLTVPGGDADRCWPVPVYGSVRDRSGRSCDHRLPVRSCDEGAPVTEHDSPDDLATPEQLEELRSLAAAAGEEVPPGIRAAEAAQRIVELRSAG